MSHHSRSSTNQSRLTGTLELDTRHGDLLDEADQPGQDDIDEVPVQASSLALEGVETDMAGFTEVLAKDLDGID